MCPYAAAAAAAAAATAPALPPEPPPPYVAIHLGVNDAHGVDDGSMERAHERGARRGAHGRDAVVGERGVLVKRDEVELVARTLVGSGAPGREEEVVGQAGELGDVGTDVVRGFGERLRCDMEVVRVDERGERERVGVTTSSPLPAERVARLITVNERAHEMGRTERPGEEEVLAKKRGDEEAHAIVQPALAPQLSDTSWATMSMALHGAQVAAHGGVDERVGGRAWGVGRDGARRCRNLLLRSSRPNRQWYLSSCGLVSREIGKVDVLQAARLE